MSVNLLGLFASSKIDYKAFKSKAGAVVNERNTKLTVTVGGAVRHFGNAIKILAKLPSNRIQLNGLKLLNILKIPFIIRDLGNLEKEIVSGHRRTPEQVGDLSLGTLGTVGDLIESVSSTGGGFAAVGLTSAVAQATFSIMGYIALPLLFCGYVVSVKNLVQSCVLKYKLHHAKDLTAAIQILDAKQKENDKYIETHLGVSGITYLEKLRDINNVALQSIGGATPTQDQEEQKKAMDILKKRVNQVVTSNSLKVVVGTSVFVAVGLGFTPVTPAASAIISGVCAVAKVAIGINDSRNQEWFEKATQVS